MTDNETTSSPITLTSLEVENYMRVRAFRCEFGPAGVVELHAKIDDDLRERIFLRKEDPARLPFAPATFDLAWACMPTRLLNPPVG